MERSLHGISEDITNIVEWDTDDLHQTARQLSFTKETSGIPRQASEADRLLGHVAFEMWARSHHDVADVA